MTKEAQFLEALLRDIYNSAENTTYKVTVITENRKPEEEELFKEEYKALLLQRILETLKSRDSKEGSVYNKLSDYIRINVTEGDKQDFDKFSGGGDLNALLPELLGDYPDIIQSFELEFVKTFKDKLEKGLK